MYKFCRQYIYFRRHYVSTKVSCKQLFNCAISSAYQRDCFCRYSSLNNFIGKVVDGSVDVKNEHFIKNAVKYKSIEDKYIEVLKLSIEGGSERDKIRHVERNKKLLVQDRLNLLFDDYSDALEIAPLAGMGMSYGDVPRAGIVTAIGRINGIYCMVGANDATVKAGTMYPISVKKQLRSLEVAMQNSLPFIFIVDSGGAFLPLQAEIFPDASHGGRTFYHEAIFNANAIPMVAVVCGSCTAGAAYVPTMAQEAVIVNQIGTIFLAGPPLVKAALGETVSTEDLGGGRMHSSISGCTDHFASNEAEAFSMTRDIVTSFNMEPISQSRGDEPFYSVNDLPGLIPADCSQSIDVIKVIARIVDGSRFHEFKSIYGSNIITGFSHIEGHLVGLVANKGPVMVKDAEKSAQFVQLCNARGIPLVFLHNSHQRSVDHNAQNDDQQGHVIRSHAQLMASVASATVSKVVVLMGNSYGIENYLLSGRSFDADFVFSWPNSTIAIADSKQYHAQLLQQAENGLVSPQKLDSLMEQYYKNSNALHASGQLWDDGIIRPQQTRQIIGKCLQIFAQKRQLKLSKLKTDQLLSPILRM